MGLGGGLYKFTLTLYVIYRSYPQELLVAESKGNIYYKYINFLCEIIVKNYYIFLGFFFPIIDISFLKLFDY